MPYWDLPSGLLSSFSHSLLENSWFKFLCAIVFDVFASNICCRNFSSPEKLIHFAVCDAWIFVEVEQWKVSVKKLKISTFSLWTFFCFCLLSDCQMLHVRLSVFQNFFSLENHFFTIWRRWIWCLLSPHSSLFIVHVRLQKLFVFL